MQTRIYRQGEQLGEERHLVPSYVVDFAFCNLSCVYCSERCFWARAASPTPSPKKFAESLFEKYQNLPERLRSIQWIGGEPILQIAYIEEASRHLKQMWPNCPPLILNTNGYFNPEMLIRMRPFVDGFVFDLKVAPTCVDLLGKAPHYHDFVESNILRAIEIWGAKNVVVRHLLVPKHVDCCTNYAIDWVERNAGQAYFNLMDSYIDFENPGEMLSDEEREKIKSLLRGRGFERLLWNGSLMTQASRE